ncbi:hypothetical protein [Clostridium sp. CF012]|uniref:hypothetical protein n=1 Tax=Clostridium sp. CF012 TaxID=2843319 RepID=UPI001C0C0444|nr:hypothetical protein [Clostridium sp. CF012]MBU3146955.1 hypothetical protein [Clostridium sp. CF012]
MKKINIKILFLAVISIFVLINPINVFAKDKGGVVNVKGYYTKNGTYVKPHYRTSPDSTLNNNWSTKGNVNPYTGKEGTIDPDSVIGNNTDSQTLTTNTAISSNLSIGSTMKQVLDVMGSPDSIIGNMWCYSYSYIDFDEAGKVISYNNAAKNLKVIVGEKINGAPSISIGSTMKQVLDVMGSPDSIIGNMWCYSYSYIDFDEVGKVTSYNNAAKNLKIIVGEKINGAPSISIGSTMKQVLDVMGSPDLIIGNMWCYSYSYIDFDEAGKVISYNNVAKNLILK